MAQKAPDGGRRYRTAAFAALAGVTPRALRHYDRLGLLKPKRTAAGYRIYAASDLDALRATPELRGEIWARRAEWMPPGAALHANVPAGADAALALARKLSESLANPEVLDFIKRARAARKR
jgi:hypothetical protein